MYNTSITPITCLSQKKKFSFYQGCCLNMFFFFSLNWMSESRGVNNGSDSLSNSARTLQPSSLPSPLPPSCAVTPLHPPPPSLPPSLCCPPCPLPPGLPPIPAPSPSLLLSFSFSFSPPLPLPLHSSPSAKNFPLQTRGLPPPLDTLPLVTLHSNTRTPHVLCKPRSFSIACSPIPTGASNRTVWAPHQLHKTQCVALYVTSHYMYVHSYFNVFSCFGI